MGKGRWWQRSLNSRLRSLKTKSPNTMKSRQRIEGSTKTFEKIGGSITIVDSVERKRIAKDLMWKAKWKVRRAKFDARAKKYE